MKTLTVVALLLIAGCSPHDLVDTEAMAPDAGSLTIDEWESREPKSEADAGSAADEPEIRKVTERKGARLPHR